MDLQQPRTHQGYFSELLVARRRSVGKPLGLPCGAYATTGSERVGGAKKKRPGTEKVLVGTRLMWRFTLKDAGVFGVC